MIPKIISNVFEAVWSEANKCYFIHYIKTGAIVASTLNADTWIRFGTSMIFSVEELEDLLQIMRRIVAQ